MKFKLGEKVLVHQSGGLKCVNDVWESIPHNCNDPSQHWESRVIGWSDFHNCPMIATRGTNPNHAEWPYNEDALTHFDGIDWATSSKYKPGQSIHFKMDDAGGHYYNDTVVKAELIVPHINLCDWYVQFMVPAGWLFRRVVNEKDFL